MKRCPSEKLVSMLVAGELAADEASRLAEHVRGCDECARLLAEYRQTLQAVHACEASPEEMERPSEAEWNRLMAGFRERVRPGAPALPRVLGRRSWAKGLAGAGVVAAAAIVVVALWQAGVFTGSRIGLLPGLARREQVDQTALRDSEFPAVPGPSADRPGGQESLTGDLFVDDRLSEQALVSDLPTEDGSAVNLAGLDSGLPELDEMIEGVGGTQDSEFMLFYLTEEEEARLVKELEGITNFRRLD